MVEVTCGNATANATRRSMFFETELPPEMSLFFDEELSGESHFFEELSGKAPRRTSITHGGTCTVTCDAGYTLSNHHSCHLGTLQAGDCSPNSCTIGAAQNPTNGAFNGAGST